MGTTENITGEFADRCREQSSIENAGRLILKCCNCNTPLIEILRTKPSVKVRTKITATCGICGDRSFTKVVDGGFYIGIIETNCKVNIRDTKQEEVEVEEGGIPTIELTVITERIT